MTNYALYKLIIHVRKKMQFQCSKIWYYGDFLSIFMRVSHDFGKFFANLIRIRNRIIDKDPDIDSWGQNDADPTGSRSTSLI